MSTTSCMAALVAASLPLGTLAYGEPDAGFAAAAIEGFTCRNSPTLLSDKSMLVPLYDQRSLWSDPFYRHGVAKLNPDGSLDRSYGQGGVASFFAPNNARTLLPLDDGKVLAVGSRVTRLNADGTIDATYGRDGGSEQLYDSGYSLLVGATVLPNQVLVLATALTDPPGGIEFRWLDRLGRAALDYGAVGRWRLPLTQESVYAWAQQPDGSLEVASYRLDAGARPTAMVRRLSIGAAGAPTITMLSKVMPSPGIGGWTSSAVKVDAFGGVVLAVGTGSIAAFGPDLSSTITLTRFAPDGSPDTSFGNGGTIAASTVGDEGQDTSQESPAALSQLPGGGWTVLVDASTGTGFGYARSTKSTKRLLRFTAAGQLDSRFDRSTRMDSSPVTQQDDGALLQAKSYFLARAVNNATVVDARCTIQRLATDAPRVESTLVEFYHPGLDHYFLTLEGLEVGILDTHPQYGWKRTGQKFGAWGAVALPGASRVCRFYGDLSAGPNSHFYIPEGAGCDGLRRLEAETPLGGAAWRLEGITFSTREAFGNQCPAAMAPVYRFYNNGYSQGRDSNHRYSVDPAVTAQMTAQGWALEGIAFCAPPLSPRQAAPAF